MNIDPNVITLIVHADDFGIDKETNLGIQYGFNNGILTSTSIMATGEAFDHAIQIARTTPKLDIGIHLTLTETKPLLPTEQVNSLISRSGDFHIHINRFLLQYMTGKINLIEVNNELEQQIKKVLKENISITHIDGHQHIHVLPKIWSITTALAKKYNIPYIRIPNEKIKFADGQKITGVSRMLQLLILRAFCKRCKTNEFNKDISFFGFLSGGKLNSYSFNYLLNNMPKETVNELMCHPGFNSKHYSYWRYNKEVELNTLCDDKTKNKIQQNKTQLISYRDLIKIRY